MMAFPVSFGELINAILLVVVLVKMAGIAK